MSNPGSENSNKLTRRQALLLSAAAGLGAALTGTAHLPDGTKGVQDPARLAGCSRQTLS